MEKKEKRQKQKETFKKVLRYIKKYWFYLILSILLAVITVVLTLYIPILIGDAVDEIVGAGHVDFAAIFCDLKADGSCDLSNGSCPVGHESLQQ